MAIKLDPAQEPFRKKIEERIDDMLQHTCSVVPCGLLIEQCNKFDRDIVYIAADKELVDKELVTKIMRNKCNR